MLSLLLKEASAGRFIHEGFGSEPSAVAELVR